MIFSIGYPKTGTTSLSVALQMLGFSTRHYDEDFRHCVFMNKGCNLSGVDAIVNNVEWAFPLIDKRFPNSTFIYTRRPVEEVVVSYRKHLKRNPAGEGSSPTRLALLNDLCGSLEFDDETFRLKFEMHQRAVLEYFHDRTDTLLVHSFADGWEPLCQFLHVPIPNKPYPWVNRS